MIRGLHETVKFMGKFLMELFVVMLAKKRLKGSDLDHKFRELYQWFKQYEIDGNLWWGLIKYFEEVRSKF